VDVGVQAEAPNQSFLKFVCKQIGLILLVFSRPGFEAVLGGILDRGDPDFKPKSWEGRSKSRFLGN